MNEKTLGIIGGSGLYDLPGLEQREAVVDVGAVRDLKALDEGAAAAGLFARTDGTARVDGAILAARPQVAQAEERDRLALALRACLGRALLVVDGYGPRLEENYDLVVDRLPPAFVDHLPIFAGGCSETRLKAARAFFLAPERRTEGLAKSLGRVEERVNQCLELRRREIDAVTRYLTTNRQEATASSVPSEAAGTSR